MHVGKKEKEECCGCGLCMNICPKSAITMKKDLEGFVYPLVDEKKCIYCNLCNLSCSFTKKDNEQKEEIISISYAVRHRNENTLKESQSGGAFTALTDGGFNNNFIVWGMIAQNEKVFCTYAINSEQRNQMRGSKYVQGDIIKVYKIIQKQIKDGENILFSGTPCQVDAVIEYLKNRHVPMDNFYSVDIVCHGVPSPRFWEDYVGYRKDQLHTNEVSIKFRDKSRLGWHSHEESFKVKGKKKKIYSHQYANVFYSHVTLRPSCYNCRYSCLNRVGDVTIADCWGIENNIKEFDDNKGESLLLVNSEKGKVLFNNAEQFLKVISIDIEKYIQPNMIHSTKRPNNRELFWEEYNIKGFKYVLRKYSKESFKVKLKRVYALIKNRNLWK